LGAVDGLPRTAEEISDYITETVLAEATLVCRETINEAPFWRFPQHRLIAEAVWL
jgi:hypothetical protein